MAGFSIGSWSDHAEIALGDRALLLKSSTIALKSLVVANPATGAES
jgi:hypothetical protein